ncbi:hypothetical protein [Pseudomonas sp. MWU13-2105]|uniref:hypothetical protein n=1 Tax=Pseudomonas sp. MWU13-2105 TaxID=2935074 RepID=UPI00201016EA|nr:hypothetical protein [Pseudomonas sp. MWU13-2105]
MTGAPVSHALGLADWLGLAGAPTFAIMALLTASDARSEMACAAMPGPWALNGMVTMYLIMSAFHLPPWLRLIAGRVG